jgi:uncharacterized protein (DUF2147 family)
MPDRKAPRGDRLQLVIKDFGRTAHIKLYRGKAEISKDGKTVIIRYEDSPARKI